MKIIFNSGASITFEPKEQGMILKTAHEVGRTTGEVAQRLVNMYEANLDEDLKSVAEMFEEDIDFDNTEKVKRLRRSLVDENISYSEIVEIEDWCKKLGIEVTDEMMLENALDLIEERM